ncbi:MAG TPA: YchJ family metal-binding protein [Eoetvoesiella sp.]
MKKKQNDPPCPCGGKGGVFLYRDCCGPFINDNKPAPSAEQLMRSRYTAYALGNADYILATWHASTRPAELTLESPGTPHSTRWLGLEIHSHTQLNATEAQVMFTARYREAGRAGRLKELSRFVLENEQWFYLDGDIQPQPKNSALSAL